MTFTCTQVFLFPTTNPVECRVTLRTKSCTVPARPHVVTPGDLSTGGVVNLIIRDPAQFHDFFEGREYRAVEFVEVT